MTTTTRLRAPDTALGRAIRGEFALNVRRLRLAKAMSQADLGRAAGLNRSFISQLETGKFSATLETVAALANAFDVPPGRLLTGASVSDELRRPRRSSRSTP